MPLSLRWAATARASPRMRLIGTTSTTKTSVVIRLWVNWVEVTVGHDLVQPHVVGRQPRHRRRLVEHQLEVAQEGIEGEDAEEDHGRQQEQVGQQRLLAPPRSQRAARRSPRPQAQSGSSRRRGGRPRRRRPPRCARPHRATAGLAAADWRTMILVPSSVLQITWVSAPSSSTMITLAAMGPAGSSRRPRAAARAPPRVLRRAPCRPPRRAATPSRRGRPRPAGPGRP